MKALNASAVGPFNGGMRLFSKPLINGKGTIVFRLLLPEQKLELFVKTTGLLTKEIIKITHGLNFRL
jgi:hypothetical protein